MKLLFVLLEKDWEFYQKAFQVTGQNSFEEMMGNCFDRVFKSYLDAHAFRDGELHAYLDESMAATYYSVALTVIIRLWMSRKDKRVSAEQMTQACYYLMTHSMTELIHAPEES